MAAANGEFKTFLDNYWDALRSGNLLAVSGGALFAGLGDNTPNLNRVLAAVGQEAMRAAQVLALTKGALVLWKAVEPLTQRFVSGVLDASTRRLVVGQGGFVPLTIESEIQALQRRLVSNLPEDKAALADWFGKPGSKKQFLDTAKSIEDVRLAYRKGYVSLDDLRINYPNSYLDYVGDVVGRYDILNPGPLDNLTAATFSSGRYAKVVLQEDLIMYRVHTNLTNEMEAQGIRGAKEMGAYWSFDKPEGSLQAIIDSALIPEWHNQATYRTAIRIPKGQTLYVGESSSQGGFYVGGKSQVLIEGGPKESWVIERKSFND